MGAISGWKDKVLFTPGPLTTSRTVKQAMLRDLGSRDFDFIETVKDMRRRLLEIGQVSSPEYEAIPVQGSGTFSIEAVFASTVRPEGHVLIVINGAYGRRMAKICATLGIRHTTLECVENRPPDTEAIEKALSGEGTFTDVAVVHCETTTGIVNPIQHIGELVKAGAPVTSSTP